MSLSQEAIQLITDTALLAAGKTLSTYSPTAVLPEGVKVVDLEKYQVGRSRFRGVFSTSSLVDFSSYVTERAIDGARGFIDQDEMTCTLIFNLGTQMIAQCCVLSRQQVTRLPKASRGARCHRKT